LDVEDITRISSARNCEYAEALRGKRKKTTRRRGRKKTRRRRRSKSIVICKKTSATATSREFTAQHIVNYAVHNHRAMMQ
jgi:hypothetical protein